MRRILTYPDPRLTQACEEVPESSFGTEQLYADCQELVRLLTEARGAGLAANQIGWMQRAFAIVDTGVTPQDRDRIPVYVLVNPEVTVDQSAPVVRGPEGCLSFPSMFEDLPCRERCEVKWRNPDGTYCEATFTDQAARCAIHENDHLWGRLLIDRMGKLQRQMFIKRYFKSRRGGSGAATPPK